MSDRVSQLQEAVNMLASAFSDSVGMIQNEIQRGASADEIDDCTKQYSQNISSIVNDVKLLIHSLPDDNMNFLENSIDYIEDEREDFYKRLQENFPIYERIKNDTNQVIDSLADVLIKLKNGSFKK